MKQNKQEQLVEDIFDDLLILSQGASPVFRNYWVINSFHKAYKELMGRETHPISAEVYVSDVCLSYIINRPELHGCFSVRTFPNDFFKNKARIVLEE